MGNTYSLRKFLITVAIPIITFWTVLFLFGYPLPYGDDLYFTGAAINLANGGEFTNPFLEGWNAVFKSGKFYYQPPFYSFTLAAWLKLAGISTTSLLFFQYLCYNIFCLYFALLLRFYTFPRITAFCATVLFAAWHCNPNPYYSTGFRQDALGMAYLALGLWLLTKDNWWRYFLGFSFVGSAVFTSPITLAYAIPFGVAIPAINFIYRQKEKVNIHKYFLTRGLVILVASVLVFTLFLLCINFDLQGFWSDFYFHASFKRASYIEAIPQFLKLIGRAYGIILNVPSYVIFVVLFIVTFRKHLLISKHQKILIVGLTIGIILNIFLYAAAIWFAFFFCWVGIVLMISLLGKQTKIRFYASVLAILLYLISQSLNIVSLIGREYVPESEYQKVREIVIDNPNRKFAIDEVAARFVFDYKLPKNTISWNFLKAPLDPMLAKDKKPDVTWIVSKSNLANMVPEMQIEYPRVEFMGRKFNSLPKNPFDVTVIP